MVLAEDHKLRQNVRFPMTPEDAVYEVKIAVEAIADWLTGPHPKHRICLARLYKIMRG